MIYEIEELPNYHLHIIKTKKFKSIDVTINFRREINENNCSINNILTKVLIDSSKKYKTGKDIEIETEELYGSYIGMNIITSGKCTILSANTTFLHDKYTEKGQFKKAINLLYELLLNPNVQNNKFDEKAFLFSKDNLKNEIKSRKDYPSSYSVNRLVEEINPKHPMAFQPNINDLKKITPTSLYNHYLDIINNDTIDIFVIGDITQDMINYIKEKFNFKPRNYKKLNHFLIEKNICKNLISKESLPVNQSIITMGFVFDDLNIFERRYVMHLMNYILGGSSDSLLFNTVREKESLCYNVTSSYSLLSGKLLIKAGIDKNKFNKTKNLILEQVKNLQNGKFSLQEIKKGKTCYINSCTNMLDQISGISNLYRSMCFNGADNIDIKIKNINKVTKKDIVSLANKMHLSKIFFLEGGK